jgi:hypothetical protein
MRHVSIVESSVQSHYRITNGDGSRRVVTASRLSEYTRGAGAARITGVFQADAPRILPANTISLEISRWQI